MAVMAGEAAPSSVEPIVGVPARTPRITSDMHRLRINIQPRSRIPLTSHTVRQTVDPNFKRYATQFHLHKCEQNASFRRRASIQGRADGSRLPKFPNGESS